MAARLVGAALDATAAVGEAPPFHEDCARALPALGDAAIEARAAIGSHASFHVMPGLAVTAVHPDQSAAAT